MAKLEFQVLGLADFLRKKPEYIALVATMPKKYLSKSDLDFRMPEGTEGASNLFFSDMLENCSVRERRQALLMIRSVGNRPSREQ